MPDPSVTIHRNKEGDTIDEYTLKKNKTKQKSHLLGIQTGNRKDIIDSQQIPLKTAPAIHPRSRILQSVFEKGNTFLEYP